MFAARLEAEAPLAGAEGIVVPFDAVGQLPFVERFVRHARSACPDAAIELRDHCVAEPDLLDTFASRLPGCRVTRARREELTSTPAAEVPRGALAVTWSPTASGLASGRSGRRLGEAVAAWREAGVSVELEVCVPVQAMRARCSTPCSSTASGTSGR